MTWVSEKPIVLERINVSVYILNIKRMLTRWLLQNIYVVPVTAFTTAVLLFFLFAFAQSTCEVDYNCCTRTLVKPWCSLSLVSGNLKLRYYLNPKGMIIRDYIGNYFRRDAPHGACSAPFAYYDDVCIFFSRQNWSLGTAASFCVYFVSQPCSWQTLEHYDVMNVLQLSKNDIHDPNQMTAYIKLNNRTIRSPPVDVASEHGPKKMYVCCAGHYSRYKMYNPKMIIQPPLYYGPAPAPHMHSAFMM